MKCLIALLTIACVHVSARTNSQSITIVAKNSSLQSVFRQVEKQTDYRFIYTKEELANTLPVTINMHKASLDEVLQTCLADQPLTFTIEDKLIIIHKKEKAETALRLSHVVNGRVTSTVGSPLFSATVSVKGTRIVTFTNEHGEFQLSGIEPNATLVVSSAEMETVEIKVNGRAFVSVVMSQKINQLDETLVVGYGTTTKRFSAGNVGRLGHKEISKQPVGNPISALQGRIAGLFVQTENGLPGGNIKVQVRGRSSVAAGTNPLYIIDGVPFLSSPFASAPNANGANGQISPFSIINPADIESIEILKDAVETAIYGSRGANGVVLITTRKGNAGRVKCDINIYTGAGTLARRAKLLGLQDYLAIRRKAFENTGIAPGDFDAPDLLRWDTTKSTDWQDHIYGNRAGLTNAQLDVSGGSAQTKFLVGGNFRSEGTILPGDNRYRRAGGHLSVDHHSADSKFNMSARVLYSRDHNRIIYDGLASSFIQLPPNFPLYHPDGEMNWDLGYNPAALLLRNSQSKTNNIVTNAGARYRIRKNHYIKMNAGYSRITLDRISNLPKAALDPAGNAISTSLFAGNSQESYVLEPLYEYRSIWKNLNLVALFGMTYQHTVSESWSVDGINYANDDLLGNMGSAGLLINPTNSFTENKYVSAFSRIDARWHDRYILSLNFRRDGSTRFGPEKEFGNFYSVGAAWIFSSEKFMNWSDSFLSHGKIRSSFGVTGNDQIGDYAFLSSYGNGGSYQGQNGLRPLRLANPNYSWETNHKWEIGLELGLMKDRLLVTGSHYRNRSGNQLVPYTLPSQTGFTNYQANLPALVLNKGTEIELVLMNDPRRKVSFRATMNISFPENILLTYPGLEQSSFADMYVVGQDLSIVRGFRFLNINPEDGVPRFEDINKDGVISYPDDFQVIGKTSPRYFGGFGQTIGYKGIELSLFFDFIQQRSMGTLSYPGLNIANNFSGARDYWKGPGHHTHVPVPIVPSASPAFEAFSNMLYSDYLLQNTSYIRLKNVQLSYTFPGKMVKKLALQRIQVFAEAQNLFTWTGRDLVDPETMSGTLASMPVTKQIAAGIQIGF